MDHQGNGGRIDSVDVLEVSDYGTGEIRWSREGNTNTHTTHTRTNT